MATKTLYLKDALAGTSQFGSLQDGGSAPTAATTATGWNTGQKATGQSCLMDYAVEVARTAAGWGTTLQPSAAPTNTVGDGWRTENPLTGTFANTAWSFSFLARAVTLANTNLMRLRIRVWASTTQDFSANVRELTSTTLTTNSTTNPLSTSADQTLSVNWSPGSITLNNEYLLVQMGIEVTTGGSTGNNQDFDFRVGSSAVTTPDFTSTTNAANTDTTTVVDSDTALIGYNSAGTDSATVSENNVVTDSHSFAKWAFDESGTPTDLSDGSGLGSFPLVVTYGASGAFAAGWRNNAFYFNNSSAYFSRQFASKAWADLVANEFTIEAVVKDVGSLAVGYYPLLAADVSPRAGIYVRFGIRVLSSSDVRLWINRTTASGEAYQQTSVSIPELVGNTGWRAVAVAKTVVGGLSTHTFYVDGKQVGQLSGDWAYLPPTTDNPLVSIGAAQDTGGTWGEFFPTAIDSVQVWNKALAPTELLANVPCDVTDSSTVTDSNIAQENSGATTYNSDITDTSTTDDSGTIEISQSEIDSSVVLDSNLVEEVLSSASVDVADTSTVEDSSTAENIGSQLSNNIDSCSITDSTSVTASRTLIFRSHYGSAYGEDIVVRVYPDESIKSTIDSSVVAESTAVQIAVSVVDSATVIDDGSLKFESGISDSALVVDSESSYPVVNATDTASVNDSDTISCSVKVVDNSTTVDSDVITQGTSQNLNDSCVCVDSNTVQIRVETADTSGVTDVDTVRSTVNVVDAGIITEEVASNELPPNTVPVVDVVTAGDVNVVTPRIVNTDTAVTDDTNATVQIVHVSDSSTVVDSGLGSAAEGSSTADIATVVDSTEVLPVLAVVDVAVVDDGSGLDLYIGTSDNTTIHDTNVVRVISGDAPTVTTNDILERAMGVASRMIAKYGGPLELVKFVDAAPPVPEKPWRIESSTAIVQTVMGVFLTARRTKYGLATDNQMDSFGMQGSEKRLLIAAQGLENSPNLKGEIRVNGDRWKIVSIQTVGPDNNAILYTLQVRQ